MESNTDRQSLIEGDHSDHVQGQYSGQYEGEIAPIRSEYEIDMYKFLSIGWSHQQENLCGSITFLIILIGASIGAQYIPIPVVSFLVRFIIAPIYWGFYRVFYLRSQGKPVSFLDFFYIMSHPLTWAAAVVLLFIIYLMIALGLLLFILPGIYFMVALIFAPVIFTCEWEDNKSLKHPIETSMSMMKFSAWQGWWKTLVFVIVLWLINLAGALCFVVGLFITIPWTAFTLAAAWEHNRVPIE